MLVTGIMIGVMGYVVARFSYFLIALKFKVVLGFVDSRQWAAAFLSLIGICMGFAFVAGLLCYYEPNASGSGIPEVKTIINGVNLHQAVRIKVLFPKVVGMCFSFASGLALGKEGPLVHAGAIVGAAISQGKTMTFGVNTSWTKFQDLRNDRSKRDYITFGAAAGIAAAFSAPIGGILFTLEEGSPFWSTTLTFRTFFCSMMTLLVLNLLYSGLQLGINHGNGLFAFGVFDNFEGYATYELIFFAIIGVFGGVFGAYYNVLNDIVCTYRKKYLTTTFLKISELLALTFLTAVIAFIAPLIWNTCTDIPTDTAGYSSEEVDLLDKLVQYNCNSNQYNQVASLYMVSSDVAMQQLYHFKEVDGSKYTTFDTGALLLFFIPYYFLASITVGTFCPAGALVSSLLAGAGFGRIVGHLLNIGMHGYVTNSGIYSLIGAAAMLGGTYRMPLSGTVVIVEASGNSQFLLPLMITFAAARYVGNMFSDSNPGMKIKAKHYPVLDSSMKTMGLLNYNPVAEIMSEPVICLRLVNRVSDVYSILKATKHNGFPVVSKNSHLRGLISSKVLCTLLARKAFVTLIDPKKDTRSSNSSIYDDYKADDSELKEGDGMSRSNFTTAPLIFHDSIEKTYPRFPKIGDVQLTPEEMVKTCFVVTSYLLCCFLSIIHRICGLISDLIWTPLLTQFTPVHLYKDVTGTIDVAISAYTLLTEFMIDFSAHWVCVT